MSAADPTAAQPAGSPPARPAARRLFFALWPDAGVRARLADLARACRVACGGRAIPGPNVHITLAFLGDVSHARLAQAIAVGDALQGDAFVLHLDTLAWWPRKRLVYAAPCAPPPALLELAGSLARGLAGVGFAAEERPYRAHVTLVRDAVRGPDDVVGDPTHWPVGEYALVESLRSARGVTYRRLHGWTLAGRADMLATHREEC